MQELLLRPLCYAKAFLNLYKDTKYALSRIIKTNTVCVRFVLCKDLRKHPLFLTPFTFFFEFARWLKNMPGVKHNHGIFSRVLYSPLTFIVINCHTTHTLYCCDLWIIIINVYTETLLEFFGNIISINIFNINNLQRRVVEWMNIEDYFKKVYSSRLSIKININVILLELVNPSQTQWASLISSIVQEIKRLRQHGTRTFDGLCLAIDILELLNDLQLTCRVRNPTFKEIRSLRIYIYKHATVP